MAEALTKELLTSDAEPLASPPVDRGFSGVLTEADAARLARSRVFVAGLGNIGSPLVFQLARMGVGQLRLCDRDRVEARNLRNQHYSRPADVGRYKAEVMAEQVSLLNPGLQVEAIVADLHDVPSGRFADVDLCLGALDSLGARQVLANARAYPQGLPVVDGGVDAAGEWLGKVQIFAPEAACLECGWSPLHYRQAARETPCDPRGAASGPPTQAPALLGTAVSSVMAAEAIKILLGHVPAESMEIVFDLASRRWLTSRLHHSAKCRFDHRIIRELLLVPVPFASATVGDLVAVVRERFECGETQLEFRRGTFGNAQFGSSRFTTVAHLESLAHRPLAALGLIAHDRIRVEAGGVAAFLAWPPA